MIHYMSSSIDCVLLLVKSYDQTVWSADGFVKLCQLFSLSVMVAPIYPIPLGDR